MKSVFSIAGLLLIYTIFALSSCATQQEEAKAPAKPAAPAETKQPPAAAKAPEPAKAETKAEAKAETKADAKAKAEKAKGDVGLLDTEKNYLILVTKEGKLITIDFDQKAKVTMVEEKPAKMSDVGLGSAADVEYVTKGDKNLVTKMQYKAAKGGD